MQDIMLTKRKLPHHLMVILPSGKYSVLSIHEPCSRSQPKNLSIGPASWMTWEYGYVSVVRTTISSSACMVQVLLRSGFRWTPPEVERDSA